MRTFSEYFSFKNIRSFSNSIFDDAFLIMVLVLGVDAREVLLSMERVMVGEDMVFRITQ